MEGISGQAGGVPTWHGQMLLGASLKSRVEWIYSRLLLTRGDAHHALTSRHHALVRVWMGREGRTEAVWSDPRPCKEVKEE